MSFNDGRRLLVFGLSFVQQDNRKMQQILGHYHRLPDTINRASLFAQLNTLAKELSSDENNDEDVQKLTNWMQNGGDFPLSTAQPTTSTMEPHYRYGPGRTLNNPSVDGDDYTSNMLSLTDPDPENHNDESSNHDDIMAQGYYGPGRTLDDLVETVNPDTDQVMAEIMDQDLNMNDPWHTSDQIPRAQYDDDEDEDDQNEEGDDNDDNADTTLNDWTTLQSGHHFTGRGRTLNDAPETETHDVDEMSMGIDNPLTIGNQGQNAGRAERRLRQVAGPNIVGLHEAAGQFASMHVPTAAQRLNLAPVLTPGIDNGDARIFDFGPGRTLSDPQPVITGDENEDTNITNSAIHESIEDTDSESDESDQDMQSLSGQADSNLQGGPEDLEECSICAEEYPPSKFPKRLTITDLCDHPDMACLECLDSSITSVIERGALHLLACPICPQKFTRKDVKEYASREIYKRYKYLKRQSEIPGHYIACMNPKCNGSQPHPSEDPKMICQYCNFATCAHHKRPWHQDQTCSEFDLDEAQLERLEEEEATAKLLSQESTSICPKCGQGVTKADGCDHMRCQCGEEWCYVCSCSYENVIRHGATAHATFCIYHPNKVNLTKSQQEAARKRIMGLVHGGEISAELAKARDELRKRRREEIRPKVAEAAMARWKLAAEQERREAPGVASPAKKKQKVKLVAPWEEGGTIKKAL